MICYNCPDWIPSNSSSVNGYCPLVGSPMRADAECVDPDYPFAGLNIISGSDLLDQESLDVLRKVVARYPTFNTKDMSIERIGEDAYVTVFVRGLFAK